GVYAEIESGDGICLRFYLAPRLRDRWRRLPAKPEVTTLGELEVGDCFVFIDQVDRAFAANYFDLDKPLRRGYARQDLGSIWVTQDGTHERCSMAGGDRVCRVPPPQTSAGSGDAAGEKIPRIPGCQCHSEIGDSPCSAHSCRGCDDAVAEVDGLCERCRWPGADPAWIPALEAKLAEQLKSGGYDCPAQRRLMVRAEKLVQEEHRDWCRKACSAEDYPGGLSQLRLPKPL